MPGITASQILQIYVTKQSLETELFLH